MKRLRCGNGEGMFEHEKGEYIAVDELVGILKLKKQRDLNSHRGAYQNIIDLITK